MERGRELAALEQCLHSARDRAGSAVLIDAPAGSGKSCLLSAVHEMAARANLQVLAAEGSELERDLSLGLVAHLLAPMWPTALAGLGQKSAGDPIQVSASLPEAARPAQSTPVHGHNVPLLVRHLLGALRDVARSLGETDEGGLVLTVDDAQWADAPSLSFLAALAQRLEDLPIALIVAAQSDGNRPRAGAESTLRSAVGRVLRPVDLSDEGVATLIRNRFPEADSAFCLACARLTGGNPFYVATVLDQLAEDEPVPTSPHPLRMPEQIPERIAESVGRRLDALPPRARHVAHAIAILGAEATVPRVAHLTALDSRAVLEGADTLAQSHLLSPGIPLSFAQPLIGPVVLSSLPPFSRARAHRSAALILIKQDGDVEEIAEHLLQAPPDDDPSVIGSLREAARRALADDDAERSASLLARALEESPGPDVRVGLLTELARVEARTARLTNRDRLNEAARLDVPADRRAELALANGQALYVHGHFEEAADVLQVGATELEEADRDLSAALTATYAAAATLVAELRPSVLQMRDELLAGLSAPPTPLQRAAIAHTLVYDALLGATRSRVRELAELAWGDGALREADAALNLSSPLLCAALVLADELERAIEIVDAVQGDSEHRMIPAVAEMMACIKAWALYLQGSVAEAESHARALLGGSASRRIARPGALALIAACHLECGRADEAEGELELMREDPVRHPVYDALHLALRAHLRLAQHRAQEALADATEAGLAMDAVALDATPGLIPWRSTVALAHLALSEPERARPFVSEELTRASRLDLQRVIARDLRILGLTLNGGDVDVLARAIETGDQAPLRLEHARALVDYGAALRRNNRRADARGPLRRGLDFSHRGGATALEARARIELVAAGARPRRAAASGVSSLTASQRRVADLAARGLTTRKIADSLFVTPKTVEFHLRQIYIKLDVASREALAEALLRS